MRPGLIPGVNVDQVDIAAGCRAAAELGYSDETSQMVVEYALQRWSRGEEDGALRTIKGHIDLTSFYVIVAKAVTAGGE